MTNILHLQTCLFLLASLKHIEYTCSYPTLHGRYTRDINTYQLALPHKLTRHGKFLSFSLPHYFKHESHNRRKKRHVNDAVDYGLVLDGKYHHLRLYPNNKLLSPHAFVEHRDPTIELEKRKLKMLKGTKVCHYIGKIKGVPNSRIALSTCDGLAGHIRMNGKNYLIEPLHDHGPNKKGHHMHIIHKRGIAPNSAGVKFCGTSDDWVEDWKKKYKHNKRADNESVIVPHTKRTVKSLHRYIEILAVCDKLFMDTHKHLDVQNYVLTFFNMVYDLYHDASIGNMIDVSLVRIIYFEKVEDEIDIEIKPEAIGTLERFCQWQQTINPKDIKSPIHHDVAILVTRYDICDLTIPGDGCVLLGLAYVGTPCTTEKPCAYCEEGGLSVGYVITHELGHVMGCSHDNFEISGCNSNAPDGSSYVMGDTASDNVTTWSSCSRDYITTLLDAGFGECLNDEPDESAYRYAHMLPGVVFDGNIQCSWIQEGSKLCSFANDEICENLLCNPANTTKCLEMFGKMAMPGTQCAENKWCYKAKCVDKGKRPDAIDGGWSEWSGWGTCTRTCGGGVRVQKRECNNPTPEHGGRFCIGERQNIKMCNWQACPEGSKDYRATQCAAFNNKTVMGKKTVWTPYVFKNEPCVLYCLDEKNQYSKLSSRVKDGTKCKLGSRHACIAGVCRKIGCDYVIGSEKEEDTCGVCGGTGKTCTIVEKSITEVKRGYYFCAEIPRGAFNVRIAEAEPCDNTLALGDQTGKLCLNEDNKEYPDGVYPCAGASVVYLHPELDKELAIIRGPLTQSIFFYIRYYVKRNPGFTVTYADLTQQRPGYSPEYRWDHVEFSPCTALCEGGTQVSEASCVEAQMGKLSPDFCSAIPKPAPITRVCNEQPCEIRWRVGAWGPCKACKGAAGVRVREVECVKEPRKEGGDDVIIEEDKCPATRPPSRDYCVSKRSCAKKRSDSGFPEKMMKELFYQTVVDMLDLDPELKAYFVAQARTIRALRRHLKQYKRAIDLQELCGLMTMTTVAPSSSTITGDSNKAIDGNGTATDKESDKKVIMGPNNKTKIEIGSNIFDRKHPERLKVAEVHSAGIVPLTNLSEEAFQVVGNQIGNTIVVDEKRNYSGKQALQCLVNLQNLGRNHST